MFFQLHSGRFKAVGFAAQSCSRIRSVCADLSGDLDGRLVEARNTFKTLNGHDEISLRRTSKTILQKCPLGGHSVLGLQQERQQEFGKILREKELEGERI